MKIDIVGLVKETVAEWNNDNAPRLGAALAYYTIFSLAPLLVLAISIAGLVFGQEAAQGQIFTQARGLLGDQGAEAIQAMVQNANKPAQGTIAAIIGFATLLLGASGVFGELQASLNIVWDIEPKRTGFWETIKQRFFSFTLVLGTGFLLLVSLILSAVLAGLVGYIERLFPGMGILGQVLNLVVGFAVTTLLFGLLYKLIPDAEVAWKDVWIGAAVTALLFTLGRIAIGIYLGRASVGSAYGAAGTLVVLLIWIYYSAQILFFGAEFTQVYANKYGSMVKAEPGAVALKPNPGGVEGQQSAEPDQKGSTADQPEQVGASADSAPANANTTKPGAFGSLAMFAGMVLASLGIDAIRNKNRRIRQ